MCSSRDIDGSPPPKAVLLEQTRCAIWPATPPSEEDCKQYKRAITAAGWFSVWGRLPALLHAAALYEETFPDLVTLCVGTGTDAEADDLKALATALGLNPDLHALYARSVA